jgi:hypothetical protein
VRHAARLFLCLLSCGHLLGELGAAQDVRAWFYHGLNGTTTRSRVFAIDKGDGAQSGSGTSFTFTRDVGAQVCFAVPNAHPVKYSYALNRSVDSAAPKLPDIASYAGLLKKILDEAASKPQRVAGQQPDTAAARLDSLKALKLDSLNALLRSSLVYLSIDLEEVSAALVASDTPEPFLEVKDGKLGNQHGFAYAQAFLENTSKAQFHFSDPALAAHVETLAKAFLAWAGQDEILQLLAKALGAYARSLLEARNAIAASYVAVNGDIELCGEVAEGKNTFALTIQKKDSTGNREVGENLVKVTVLSNYKRPSVTLDPLAFVAFAPRVRQFQIINDTLRGPRDDATAFRPGALISLNVKRLGDTQEFGLGVGLGFGLGAGGKALSDLLGGIVLSYRDAFRVGFGAGISRFPESVRGATLDQPLPADAGKLDDLIETKYKGALFLLFTLPGIGVPGT